MKNLYNEADKNENTQSVRKSESRCCTSVGKDEHCTMLAHLNVSLETPLGKNIPQRAFYR